MDEIDERIVAELRADARLSVRALAKRVHLSPPAVAARVHRLEDGGVIVGYGARVDPRRSARPVRAYVDVTMHAPRHAAFAAFVHDDEAIRACERVSGDACYLLRVEARDHAELDEVLGRVERFGAWRASVVLASLAAKD